MPHEKALICSKITSRDTYFGSALSVDDGKYRSHSSNTISFGLFAAGIWKRQQLRLYMVGARLWTFTYSIFYVMISIHMCFGHSVQDRHKAMQLIRKVSLVGEAVAFVIY